MLQAGDVVLTISANAGQGSYHGTEDGRFLASRFLKNVKEDVK